MEGFGFRGYTFKSAVHFRGGLIPDNVSKAYEAAAEDLMKRYSK